MRFDLVQLSTPCGGRNTTKTRGVRRSQPLPKRPKRPRRPSHPACRILTRPTPRNSLWKDSKCPRFKLRNKPGSTYGATALVFNQDSFDTAIAMPSSVLDIPSSPEKPTQVVEANILGCLRTHAASPDNLRLPTAARVAVLNMASDRNPGGGWLSGASAQEEALCFRSTLTASLHRPLYPLQRRAGLYTREVVIFRTAMNEGHTLMIPETPVINLPVVSALSMAGVRRPDVKPAEQETDVTVEEAATGGKLTAVTGAAGLASEHEGTEDHGSKDGKAKEKKGARAPRGPFVFADPAARELTKDKMRLCLRMAATKGHTMLVLGALGCGAFRNPPREVADCWLELLSEAEFAGGWFKEVWSAVYDRRNEGNFEIFRDMFDGKVVG